MDICHGNGMVSLKVAGQNTVKAFQRFLRKIILELITKLSKAPFVEKPCYTWSGKYLYIEDLTKIITIHYL